MKFIIVRLLNCCAGLLFLCPAALAASQEGSAVMNRPGCGDYSILSSPADRAIFERHCGTNDESDHQIMLDLVTRLDPRAEARKAARRGDFRLAAIFVGGPPSPEQKRRWVIDGVSCKKILDEDVVIWHRSSDVMFKPPFSALESSMDKFGRVFNAALFHEKDFPRVRECTISNDIGFNNAE